MNLYALLVILGTTTTLGCSIPTLTPFSNATVTEHSGVVFNCSCSQSTDYAIWEVAKAQSGTYSRITTIQHNQNQCLPENPQYNYTSKNTSFKCSDDKLWFTMKMSNITRSLHGNKFKCQLFLGGFIQSGATTMYVRVPVEHVELSGNFQNVIEHQLSKFTCTTSEARPRSTIEWHITNVTAPPLKGDYVSPIDKDVLARTVSILSYRFNRSQNGRELYCTAANIDGEPRIYSMHERISVKYAPDTGPTIVNFTNGSVYELIEAELQNLTCYVTGGNPVPSLRWNCYSGNVTNLTTAGEVRESITWSTSNRKNGYCICSATQEISGTVDVVLNTSVLYPPSVPQFYANNTWFNGTLFEIEGRSVVISCTSTSNPSPHTYTWTTNASLPDNDSGTIRLLNVQLSNEGTYTCTVTNTMTPSVGAEKDGINNAYFSLERLYPPKPPTLWHSMSQLAGGELKVIQGDDVEVMCHSSSNPAPSYSWTGLSNENKMLKINSIQISETGMYTCTATNIMFPTVGDNIEDSAKTDLHITVMRPPSKTVLTYLRQKTGSIEITDGEKLKVIKGFNFSLRCASLDGIPSPSYSWAGPSHNRSGPVFSADGTVNFTSIDVPGKGNYTCNATNIMERTDGTRKIGTQIRSVFLDILYKPVIEEMKEQVFKENEAVNVQCIADSNPSPSTYSWTRSKGDFQQSSLNLKFEHISRNDTDLYYCTVTNTMHPTGEETMEGLGSRTVSLRVLYPPDVAISQRNGSTLTEGDKNVMLLCSADGEPTKYTFGNWIQYAPDGTTKVKEYRAEEYANDTVSLTFPNASYMDSGFFVCSVSNGISDKNGLSHAMTNTTQIVKGKPIVTNRELGAIAAVLGNSTLQVSFYSNDGTNSTVQWYKTETGSKQEIWNNASRMFHKTKPDQVSVRFYNVTFLQTGTTSQLFIHNVTEDDFSEYEVVITNTIGQTVTKIQLDPQGPPDCPDKFEIEESTVTSSTITVTWVSGFYGGANQTFHVDYKTSTSLWKDGPTVNGFTIKDALFDAMVSNLSSDTEYRFRIYAANIYGRSKCNLTKTARTMSDANDPVSSTNVGLIAGGVAGGIVLAAIVVAMFLLFLRKRRDLLKSPSKSLLKDNARTSESNGADNTPEINLNPMYEPAGLLPSTSNNSDVYSQVDKNRKKTKLGGDIYSQVDKPKRRQKTGGSEVKNDVYAQVQKKTHKEKNADKTNHKKQKQDKKTKKERQTEGDVYDNVNTLNETLTKGDTVYENPSCSIEDEYPKQMRNQDGLIYADLDLPNESIGKGRQVVVHGLDDRTDYADIKYGEVGEQAAESDEENTKKE